MNKAEIVAKIAKDTGLTKVTALAAVDAANTNSSLSLGL